MELNPWFTRRAKILAMTHTVLIINQNGSMEVIQTYSADEKKALDIIDENINYIINCYKNKFGNCQLGINVPDNWIKPQ